MRITDEQIQIIESVGNFLRGMAMFDYRLPKDTKEAILSQVVDIDKLTEELNQEE